MQRYEVEAIFEQKKDGLFEDINISSQNTFSLRCLGQSRSFQRFAHCGKSPPFFPRLAYTSSLPQNIEKKRIAIFSVIYGGFTIRL